MLPYSRSSQRRRGANGKFYYKSAQVYVHLRAGQSIERPLLKLVELFGGGVKDLTAYYKYKGQQKVYFEWNLFGAKAVEVLRQIRPYLLVKAENADLCIAFYEECNGVAGNLERRLEYVKQMQEVQRKGTHLRKPFDKSGDAIT